MMDVLRLTVLCWLTFIALLAVRALWQGNRATVFVLLIGHWVFCGLPLLWDLVLGLPSYERFPNFARAAQNEATTLIYLLYVAAIPVVVALIGLPWRRGQAQPTLEPTSDHGLPTWVLYGMLGLPVVMMLIAPRPEFYLRYGFIVDDALFLPADVLFHHGLLTVSCILAVAAATTLLSSRDHLVRQFFITLPFVMAAIFLMGKRAIAALYLVLLTQRLWDLNLLRNARLLIYGAVALGCFALFATGYQMVVRNITTGSLPPAIYYENQRLDYGRDHTLRAAIYAELQGDRILSYRGQATLFDLTFAVPRTWWPQKPYPYGNYMTSYGLGVPPQLNSWTFTTTIFDEAIANYGWLGMLTAPLFMGLLCRLADGNRTILFRSLGYIVCLMFMAVQLSAFMGLFLVWIGGSFWHQYRGALSLRSSRPLREAT